MTTRYFHDPGSSRSVTAGGAEREILTPEIVDQSELIARAISAVMAATLRRVAEHLERGARGD